MQDKELDVIIYATAKHVGAVAAVDVIKFGQNRAAEEFFVRRGVIHPATGRRRLAVRDDAR